MADLAPGGDEYAQFRTTFFEECTELLADLEQRLDQMQSNVAQAEELNAVFRAVHSIKAGAGAFKFVQLVEFCHSFEAVLDKLRSGRIAQDDRISAVLVRASDVLAALVEAAQGNRTVAEGFGADVAEELQMILNEAGDAIAASPAAFAGGQGLNADALQPARRAFQIKFKPHAELFRHANEPLLLVRELKQLGEVVAECDISRLPALPSLDPDDAYLSWTFRIVTDCTQSVVADVFEFVNEDCDLEIEALSESTGGSQATAATADDRVASTAGASMEPAQAELAESKRAAGGSSIRVDLARIDRLVNMVGELVITQAMLAERISDQSGGQGHQLIQGQEDLALHTRELQECVMAIRMQPVKSVFARMPRMVREIAAKLNKKVRLITSGEQTEVDKTVIEELADPLTHMIRNSVDHGIEDPATRRANGKPEEGTIELSAVHRGGNILIQVTDDGAGIDRGKLLKKAIDRGLIASTANPTDEEIDNLIFAAGLSTAEQVTDVSGRGVGMDVVRRNISNLGGRIQVQSTVGKGTRFTLVLPLTLAVLDGMLVAVGSEKYILPLTSILESIRPERNQVRALAGGGEVVSIR